MNAVPTRGGDTAWHAIVVHPDDDVAVALRDLAAGATVVIRRAGVTGRMEVTQAIPLGHKFALHRLAAGAPIRKYGEAIGVASADIAPGAHVHVHNLESQRARRRRDDGPANARAPMKDEPT